MSKRLQNLLRCLAVLAVGAVQIFGVGIGYICGCTGEQTSQKNCAVEVCHPRTSHGDGCEQDSEIATTGTEGKRHAPVEHDHEHSEVRESVVLTSLPAALSIPPLVLYDLPDAFALPGANLLAQWASVKTECPASPENGSPPMPLLVARTMVMLV